MADRAAHRGPQGAPRRGHRGLEPGDRRLGPGRRRPGLSSSRGRSWGSARPATRPSPRPSSTTWRPPRRKGRWLAIFYTAMPVGVGARLRRRRGRRGRHPRLAHGVLRRRRPGPACCRCFAWSSPEPSVAEPGARDRAPLGARTSRARAGAPSARIATWFSGTAPTRSRMGGFAYWAPKYLHAQLRHGDRPGERRLRRASRSSAASSAPWSGAPGWTDRLARRRRRSGPAPRATCAVCVCTLSAALGAPLALAAILAPVAPLVLRAAPCPARSRSFSRAARSTPPSSAACPAGLRASAMALSIFAIHLLGDLWSPPLIGLVADHAPMAWAMLAVPAAFALGAARLGSASAGRAPVPPRPVDLNLRRCATSERLFAGAGVASIRCGTYSPSWPQCSSRCSRPGGAGGGPRRGRSPPPAAAASASAAPASSAGPAPRRAGAFRVGGAGRLGRAGLGARGVAAPAAAAAAPSEPIVRLPPSARPSRPRASPSRRSRSSATGASAREDVLSYLREKPGHLFKVENLTGDVRALWDSGFFEDIQVDLTTQGQGRRRCGSSSASARTSRRSPSRATTSSTTTSSTRPSRSSRTPS